MTSYNPLSNFTATSGVRIETYASRASMACSLTPLPSNERLIQRLNLKSSLSINLPTFTRYTETLEV